MRWLFPILWTALSGCAFDFETCATNADCDPGAQCVAVTSAQERVCLNPDSTADGGANNTNKPDRDFLEVGRNNRNNKNNLNNGQDAGPNDGGRDPDLPSSCSVSIFDSMCRADAFEPNNEPAFGTPLPETAGCPGLDFEPSNYSIDSVLCSNEPADWYALLYGRCGIRKRLFVTVTPKRECSGAEYELVVADYDCSNTTRVQCSDLGDGVKEVIVLLPNENEPGGPFDSLRIGVEEDDPDAEFEYNLEIRITD